jgi:2-alkyl-3-oxoalkanoate reductase
VRLAVTGASGFCGAAVARLAAASGWEVWCLGRRPGPVGRHVRWDAAAGPPELGGADAVVHLAAAVGDSGRGAAAEAAYRAVNVDGAARLLAAARGRPVVWVSSASVYRPGPYPAPVREDHPLDSQRSAYGRSKAAGDRLALAAGAVVLRPRAVYGPGDPHLRPRLRRLVRGGRAWLPGPDVPLSLTAVQNLADACLSAVGRWPPGAYNVADTAVYRRDAVVAAELGVPVRHVPLAVARGLAAVAAVRRAPLLTRYAVDQLSDGMVLDTARAAAQGWTGRSRLGAAGTGD